MYSLNTCLAMYPEQVDEVLFNFLDTHDTGRIAMECKGNNDLLIQKLALLLTLPGSPCLYYGTEIALGERVPYENRRCMPWDEIDRGEHEFMLNASKELIRLRMENPQFRSTDIRFDHCDARPRMINYTRSCEGSDKVIGVCINSEKEPVSFPVGGRILFSDLYENETLLPNGTVIYEK